MSPAAFPRPRWASVYPPAQHRLGLAPPDAPIAGRRCCVRGDVTGDRSEAALRLPKRARTGMPLRDQPPRHTSTFALSACRPPLLTPVGRQAGTKGPGMEPQDRLRQAGRLAKPGVVVFATVRAIGLANAMAGISERR